MHGKPKATTRSGDDFRATVSRAGPAPTGRARLDNISTRDVSYQPTERELRFIDRLPNVTLQTAIGRAEAECIVRKTLTGFASTPLADRRVLADEAKKFGIVLNTN